LHLFYVYLAETKGQFYWYKYPRHDGAKYGFSKSKLESKLEEYDHVFVIIRSATTIKDIILDFPDINVIPTFVYTIETLIEKRLRKEGYNDDEIKYRMHRSTEPMDDLYTHPTLYEHVIVNNSDKTTYQRQLKERFDLLLRPNPNVLQISAREYYQLPAALIPHKERMVSLLIHQ